MGSESDQEETAELRSKQAERETREHQLLADSERPDEADQHERRRDKAAYLKEKLAERERAEREQQGD